MSESKVVPVIPTDEMIEAVMGTPWIVDCETSVVDGVVITVNKEARQQRYIIDGWQAMLDAAPSADQGGLVGRLIARADLLSLTGASDVEKELRDAAAALQSAEAGMNDSALVPRELLSRVKCWLEVAMQSGIEPFYEDGSSTPNREHIKTCVDEITAIDAAIAGK